MLEGIFNVETGHHPNTVSEIFFILLKDFFSILFKNILATERHIV